MITSLLFVKPSKLNILVSQNRPANFKNLFQTVLVVLDHGGLELCNGVLKTGICWFQWKNTCPAVPLL